MIFDVKCKSSTGKVEGVLGLSSPIMPMFPTPIIPPPFPSSQVLDEPLLLHGAYKNDIYINENISELIWDVFHENNLKTIYQTLLIFINIVDEFPYPIYHIKYKEEEWK